MQPKNKKSKPTEAKVAPIDLGNPGARNSKDLQNIGLAVLALGTAAWLAQQAAKPAGVPLMGGTNTLPMANYFGFTSPGAALLPSQPGQSATPLQVAPSYSPGSFAFGV